MLRMGRSPKTDSNEKEKIKEFGQTLPHSKTETPAARFNDHPPQNIQQSANKSPVTSTAPEQMRSAAAAPRAVSESEALARDLKDGIVSGFLGVGTTLSGEAEFKGMLRIDGRFSGRINSEKGTLIVSTGGAVEANIEVGTAKVNGIVNGNITAAEKIELGRSAQVHGDIKTPVLIIEQGAIFEGGCRMTQAKAAHVATNITPERLKETRSEIPVEPASIPVEPASVSASIQKQPSNGSK